MINPIALSPPFSCSISVIVSGFSVFRCCNVTLPTKVSSLWMHVLNFVAFDLCDILLYDVCVYWKCMLLKCALFILDFNPKLPSPSHTFLLPFSDSLFLNLCDNKNFGLQWFAYSIHATTYSKFTFFSRSQSEICFVLQSTQYALHVRFVYFFIRACTTSLLNINLLIFFPCCWSLVLRCNRCYFWFSFPWMMCTKILPLLNECSQMQVKPYQKRRREKVKCIES